MEDSKKDLDTQEPKEDTTKHDSAPQEYPVLNKKANKWVGFTGGVMQIIGRALVEIARMRK